MPSRKASNAFSAGLFGAYIAAVGGVLGAAHVSDRRAQAARNLGQVSIFNDYVRGKNDTHAPGSMSKATKWNPRTLSKTVSTTTQLDPFGKVGTEAHTTNIRLVKGQKLLSYQKGPVGMVPSGKSGSHFRMVTTNKVAIHPGKATLAVGGAAAAGGGGYYLHKKFQERRVADPAKSKQQLLKGGRK